MLALYVRWLVTFSMDFATGAYSARAFHLDSTVNHVMNDFLDTR